jgi:hypothetical protein
MTVCNVYVLETAQGSFLRRASGGYLYWTKELEEAQIWHSYYEAMNFLQQRKIRGSKVRTMSITRELVPLP